MYFKLLRQFLLSRLAVWQEWVGPKCRMELNSKLLYCWGLNNKQRLEETTKKKGETKLGSTQLREANRR